MTLQDHVIKESGDFMEANCSLTLWNCSMYTPTLPKFIAIDIVLMDV